MENANETPRLRGSLGRIAASDELYAVEDGGSGDYTPYEVVEPTPVPKSVNDEITPIRQIQTMTASTGTVSLPKFDFSTSVESCNDCTPMSATTTSAVASKVLTVTPVKMPEVPSTTNWLLIGAALAVGYVVYKSSKPGLSGTPEPAAEPKTLGRPPRKAPVKATRHVKELTIS
jgi:hypothetical protein